MGLKAGTTFALQFFINQTDLLAPTDQELIAPFDGYIEEARGTVQVAITTGGDITFKIGTTAVAGLTLTLADAATKGTRVSDTPTAPSDTRRFSKGDRIQVCPAAAFATAGAVNGHLLLRANATRAA